ncbi:PaaI family thioesterase [Helcobacillus massiliensis]|uniref:Uncharacterized protein (TIGR00369 family) n=1 Tax=Helcobacillus massiliensis TaxID=521392 RepID=A0A839QTL7_9MICO|nr:PaaI family thioesterase [Helcobacillus massiliensis]MBB3023654.1 uncharacterized protein (TIGR00369 family) [Helcobacillus massiliensis]
MTEPDAPTHQPWSITLGELDRAMGVQVREQSIEKVVLTMPVEGNRQSFGSLHGGASIAVAEAAGSWAANIYASTMGRSAVGIEVSASHHRAFADGTLIVTATPIRLGRTLTTHSVDVVHEETGKLVASVRITNAVLGRPIPDSACGQDD